MYYRQSLGSRITTVAIYAFVVVLILVFVYPVIYCISLSISDAEVLGGDAILLLPRGFSLEAYRYLLGNSKVYRYYGNTILYAGLGTFITLLTSSMVAYSLSVPVFAGKKFVTVFLVITMFFSGGMVPTYLNIKRLNLMDTIWAMILPGISAYNVMIYKTFFKQIPESLKDAAKVDGAGHVRILFTIILPLSKPLLATMALFSIVGHWNGYLNAVLYLSDHNKYPIQMLLRSLMVTLDLSEQSFGMMADRLQTTSRSVRGAAAVVTMAPILCVYPFMQKYFAKGVMIGSVKE